MTDREILQIYTNMLPFFASVCGPGCEIVVHDITDPDHSIVAIENNVSGRELGDPLTDLARELAAQGTYADADFISNYAGRSKGSDFLSSTYFIKNEGRLIGLLCVNKDMTAIQHLAGAMNLLTEQYNLRRPQESAYSEKLDNPVPQILHTRISDIIAEIGIPPARMRMEEKVQIVHRLNETGLLSVKGAVAEVAAQLAISVPTVYRYMNKS